MVAVVAAIALAIVLMRHPVKLRRGVTLLVAAVACYPILCIGDGLVLTALTSAGVYG